MKKDNLLLFAHDIEKLKEVLARRLEKLKFSQNDLCAATGVEGSTIWRWGKNSAPNIATLMRLEDQLCIWEGLKRRAKAYSSSSISIPSARL